MLLHIFFRYRLSFKYLLITKTYWHKSIVLLLKNIGKHYAPHITVIKTIDTKVEPRDQSCTKAMDLVLAMVVDKEQDVPALTMAEHYGDFHIQNNVFMAALLTSSLERSGSCGISIITVFNMHVVHDAGYGPRWRAVGRDHLQCITNETAGGGPPSRPPKVIRGTRNIQELYTSVSVVLVLHTQYGKVSLSVVGVGDWVKRQKLPNVQ